MTLTFAGYQQTGDNAGEQEHGNGFEGEKISAPAAGKHVFADLCHRGGVGFRRCFQDFVAKTVQPEDRTHHSATDHAEQKGANGLEAARRGEFLLTPRGEQNREDVKHDDTTGIYHDLYRSEEGVAQQEIESRRAQQHKEQIGSRTHDAFRHHCGDR